MIKRLLSLFHQPQPRPTIKKVPAFSYWQDDTVVNGQVYKFQLSRSKKTITINSTRSVQTYSVHELTIFGSSPHVPHNAQKMFAAALAYARENGAAI